MNKGLKALAVTTTVFMFLVVFGGTMVTKTDSGDGCGRSWPLCEGGFLPVETVESYIEYSHRLISGIAGLLITVLLIWAQRACKERRDAMFMVTASFLFTLIQALLGAGAVVFGQSPPIMALHFGVSLIAFASVFLFTIILYRWDARPKPISFSKGYRFAVLAAAVYTYVVVYTGGYVVHSGSSGGCGRWFPLCDGQWFPGFEGASGIQFMHRLSGFLLMVLVLALMAVTVRRYRRRDLQLAGWWAGALVVLQILSGGLMVWAGLNLFTRLLHATLILFLFGVLTYLCMEVLRQPRAQEEAEAELAGKAQMRPSAG